MVYLRNGEVSKGHKGVRLLIEAVVKSLQDDVFFMYGRTSDFNQETNPGTTSIVLDPLSATPQYTVNGVSNYQKAWACRMAFYKYDKEGSVPEEYTPILDDTDSLVDKFLNKLNFYSSKADHILIQGINQDAFIKATAHIMTGQLLNFTIFAEDEFDYCADDLDCVIPYEC